MMQANPKLGCFLFLNLVGVATMLTIIIKQYSHISNAMDEIDQIKNTDNYHLNCFTICGRDYGRESEDGLQCVSIEDNTRRMKADCLVDYIQGKQEKLSDLCSKLDYYYGVQALFVAVSLFFICKLCNKPRPSLRRQRQLQRRAAIARLILHLNIWSRVNAGGPQLARRSLLSESYIAEDKDETCSVCLDSFQQQQVTKLLCGHIFHFKCVQQWVQYNNTCPVCRARQ